MIDKRPMMFPVVKKVPKPFRFGQTACHLEKADYVYIMYYFMSDISDVSVSLLFCGPPFAPQFALSLQVHKPILIQSTIYMHLLKPIFP